LPVKFRVGTSGWTYEHWKDVFYPKNLPKSRWFTYYLSQFSTVEVNATFYQSFKYQTYLNWYERTPEDFQFVLKVPRLITHIKLLDEVEEEIQAFWHSASLLKEKLGMLLLQVSPKMPVDPERLHKALLVFGEARKVAVEFRRREWLNADTFENLKSMGVTICCVDSPNNRIQNILTSDTAYIRLHGRRRWYSDLYLPEELNEIAERARYLAENGAKRVYIFFNNDFDGNAPRNALALQEQLLPQT